MKKILNNFIIIFLLLLLCSQILFKSKIIMNCVSFSFILWKNNIFPSLFPFFIISDLLINYGFVEFISELTKPIMYKLFKCGKSSSFIFIMSIISGIPSNAKYIRDLYNKGLIDDYEGSKILMFTHFSNPLFILGTLSLIYLNNKEAGFLILYVHYITNIFIGILFRWYHPTKELPSKVSFKNAINSMMLKRDKPFSVVLTESLVKSINTLLLILGIVTFFLIITTIIDELINLNYYYQSIFNGILEITQGLKYISILEIPLKLKVILSTMILSFGGLSSHMQVMSILSDTNIKYYPYFIARLIHMLLSSVIMYFVFDYFYTL